VADSTTEILQKIVDTEGFNVAIPDFNQTGFAIAIHSSVSSFLKAKSVHEAARYDRGVAPTVVNPETNTVETREDYLSRSALEAVQVDAVGFTDLERKTLHVDASRPSAAPRRDITVHEVIHSLRDIGFVFKALDIGIKAGGVGQFSNPTIASEIEEGFAHYITRDVLSQMRATGELRAATAGPTMIDEIVRADPSMREDVYSAYFEGTFSDRLTSELQRRLTPAVEEAR